MRHRKQHGVEKLRDTVQTLAATIWDNKEPPGKRLWSIPADPDNDFDLVLTDAIAELEARRSAMEAAGIEFYWPV